MHPKVIPTLLGGTLLTPPQAESTGGYVDVLGETFYKIQHYMRCPRFS